MYVITNKGTRSETRIGKLYQHGALVTGKIGQIRSTAVGVFTLFPAARYNRGWLNTRTYGRPVFRPDGTLLPEVKDILQAYEETSGP